MDKGKKKKKNKRCRSSGERTGPGDHGHMEKVELTMTNKTKKLQHHHESSCNTDVSVSCCRYDSCYYKEEQKLAGLGVFDFPWLKEEGEGVIFKGEDLCQPGIGLLEEEEEYTFACCPSLSASTSATLHHDHLHFSGTSSRSSTTSSSQIANLCPSSALPLFHHDGDHNKIYEDNPPRLSSFKVDSDNIDQQMDCIWSSVLDQPLDINLSII